MEAKNLLNNYFILLFLILWGGQLYAQCPEITSESIDPNCTSNCNVCSDDEITISLTGNDMADGSTIDFYIGPDGDDPSGETFLGSADITNDCADGPQFMYVLIDPPPGPDRCDEYAVIYTGGSGFDAEDIDIINSGGNGMGPYVLGNTAAFTPDCGLIAVGPGDFVPDDAILIIQSSAVGTEVYDITELCDLGLDIYVLASANTACGGGFFVNNAEATYELEQGCVSDILTYGPGANAWSFIDGEGNWITEVPEMEIPDPSLGVTTIDDFTFTITQDILDDLCSPPSAQLDVQGYLNPQEGGCDDVLTSIFNLTLSCPEAMELDPIDACEVDGEVVVDLTVYDIDVSGGNGSVEWYTNSDGTGSISNPSNYSGSFPVYAQVDFNGCLSNIIELEVNVFSEPNVELSIDPDPTCLGDDITIFEDGGDGVSWMWEGPGGFDSDEQNPTIDDAAAGTYSVTVTDANDCESVMEIEYEPTEGPTAIVDVSSEDLCEGSCIEVTFAVTSGSGGPYDLVWEVDAGIVIPIPWTTDVDSETWNICTTPGILPSWDPGTMTASVPDFLSFIEVQLISISEAGCEGQVDSDVIAINIVEPPTANPAGPLTACVAPGEEAEFDLSELNDEIGGGDDVLWFEDMDLMDELNPPTIETDEDISVFAVVDDGTCLSEPVEVQLIVGENGDAGEDGSITICSGITDLQDLFGALGGMPTMGGMWSDDSNSGVDLSDPMNVDFSNLDDDTYEFTYSFAGVVNCPESSATVTVVIDPPIEVEILSQECTPDDLFVNIEFEISAEGIVDSDLGDLSDLGANTYLISISTSEYEFTITVSDPNNPSCVYEYEFDVPECGCQIIPAPQVDPEYTICEGDDFPFIEAIDDINFSASWFDESGSDIILADSEDFTPSEAGTYFVQAYDILDPDCTSELVEFDVIVETPLNAGMDSTITICMGFDDIFDLNSLLAGNPDAGGSWTDIMMTGLDISDPSMVNFSALASGTWDFEYTTSNIVCPNSSAVVQIMVLDPPNPGIDNDTTLCSLNSAAFDLFNMISPADPGGTWQEATATLDLADPNQFSIDGVPSGTYLIEYIIPGMNLMSPYCDSVSSEIILTVQNPVSAGDDAAVSECVGGDIDLATYLQNNDGLGIFESTDPMISVMGSIFQTNGLMEGDYEFYHIINSTNSCPSDSALISVNLGSQLIAGMDVSENICAVSGFDLNDLLNGGDLGGSFIIESNNMIIPAGILDASSLAGQTVNIIYEIGGGSCPLDSALFTLNISEEPSFSIDPNDEIICASECATFSILTSFTQGVSLSINLLDESGAIVSSEMLMLNGNSDFDICNIDNGMLSVLDIEPDQNYSLELVSYTFMGCEYDLSETISLVSAASGILNYSDMLCANQSVTLGGVEFNEMNPNGSVAVPVANACDSIINVNLSFFEEVETFIDGTVCSSFSINVNGTNYNSSNPLGVEVIQNGASNSCDSTIFVNLDFSLDNEMLDIIETLCEGESIQVGDDIYDISNPVGQTLVPSSSQFDCDTLINVELSFAEDYELSLEPTCQGDEQGFVIIQGNSDNLPIDIFVDGQLTESASSFPYMLGLNNGTYELQLIDAAGCTQTENIDISSAAASFDIVASETSSNAYQLSINSNISIDSVVWSGNNLDCQVCPSSNTGSIIGTQEYSAIGYYGDGCEVSASIILQELVSTEIFIPNIFNPDNSGANGIFYLQSVSDFTVQEFSVFDRWGNQVFFNSNYLTNDPSQGWDGRFEGTKVAIGVYVYYGLIEIPGEGIRNIDGSISVIR